MQVRLYNTLGREVQDFVPIQKDTVGMYACGPTVYDFAHLGNLRTYIFEDILRRVLEFNGYTVRHVMNITDVGHLTSDADTGEEVWRRTFADKYSINPPSIAFRGSGDSLLASKGRPAPTAILANRSMRTSSDGWVGQNCR